MLRSILAGCVLLSGVAEARYIGPMLVKETSTGFTPEEYARTEKCEIFVDRTVITTLFNLGNIKSVSTRNQTLEGTYPDILQTVSAAKLETKNGPVDGPSVKLYGFIINADDSTTQVSLYEENGGTGQIVKNTAPEAQTLRNVVEALCPNTMNGIAKRARL